MLYPFFCIDILLTCRYARGEVGVSVLEQIANMIVADGNPMPLQCFKFKFESLELSFFSKI